MAPRRCSSSWPGNRRCGPGSTGPTSGCCRPGEVVSFPPGREGTHQILNRGEVTARVLICSTNDLPEVAEQVETGLTVVLTSEYDRLYRDGVDI